MKSLKKIFKRKPVKQIADWSLWHELNRRKLRDKFKILTIATMRVSEVFKNAGLTIKEFNESLKRVKKYGITDQELKESIKRYKEITNEKYE